MKRDEKETDFQLWCPRVTRRYPAPFGLLVRAERRGAVGPLPVAFSDQLIHGGFDEVQLIPQPIERVAF